MLKNFLTNEYGTLNPMVDLAQHQIDSGVPVTDATVQEVTRFHPTMTGMSLRDCGAISDVGLWALAKRAAEQLLELARHHAGRAIPQGRRPSGPGLDEAE